jgi:hypothetical protein
LPPPRSASRSTAPAVQFALGEPHLELPSADAGIEELPSEWSHLDRGIKDPDRAARAYLTVGQIRDWTWRP